MQTEEDEIMQKKCFSCQKFIPYSINKDHLEKCLKNISLQKRIECKGCYCLVDMEKLFKHLDHKTVRCKETYTSAEFDAIDTICNGRNKYPDKDADTGKPKSENDVSKLRRCKVCHHEFTKLLQHIRWNKDCKAGYEESDLMKLKTEIDLERKEYIEKWKLSKDLDSESKREQICQGCKKPFKRLKTHLNTTPTCQNKYSEEQLNVQLGKIDAKIKEDFKQYHANWYQSHKPSEDDKKAKSYNDKLRYELYGRHQNGVKVSMLECIFGNKMRWKANQYQKKMQSLLTNVKDEDTQVFEAVDAICQEIQKTLKFLIKEKEKAIAFLKTVPNAHWRDQSNTDACEDIVKCFNAYIDQIHILIETSLKDVQECLTKMMSLPRAQTFISFPAVDLMKKFQSSKDKAISEYTELYAKANSNQEERMEIWKLEQRRADPYEAFFKLRRIWIPKVKSTFEAYSAWVPMYQEKITEYTNKGFSKRKQNKLLDLQKSIQSTFNSCQRSVEEVLQEFKKPPSVNNSNIIFELGHLMISCMNEMEGCEVILRMELHYSNEELKEFGFIPTYEEEQVKLKFGMDPELDLIGEGEEMIMRQEENQKMCFQRIENDTEQCLQDWLKSEYDVIDNGIYKKIKSHEPKLWEKPIKRRCCRYCDILKSL